MQKLTPMFEQYLKIKEAHPDALLFYRMGDFYELFFEDAEVAARELQIALTCRNPNAEARVPMCGVPHHSAEQYLSRLLDKGYKVAICDQMEDPRLAKGLVKRAVTRILTPGTVIEESNLKEKAGNFLAALFYDSGKKNGGAAWLDFSTGEWTGLASRKEAELWQWLMKIEPRELLVPQEQAIPGEAQRAMGNVSPLPFRGYFDLPGARERVMKAQAVNDLKVLDLEDKPELTQALGAMVAYLRQTQLEDLKHLGSFMPLNLSKYLILDEVTERNLELFRTLDGKIGQGTLWHVLDRTQTPMGGRLLQQRLRQPWREQATIEDSLDAVALLHGNDDLRRRLQQSLKEVYDLERLSTRIFLNRALPKDFIALRQSMACLPRLREPLENLPDGSLPKAVEKLLGSWDDLQEYTELLERAFRDNPPPTITEGGLIQRGYNAELDECLDLSQTGEARLQALLEEEQKACNLPRLKLGYNRVFGYFFELSRTHAEKAPEHFLRRQTLANSERYTTDRLKELEDRLASSVDQAKQIEYRLFQEIREKVAEARPRLLHMAGIVAALDFWQSLASVARRWDWRRPSLHQGMDMRILDGRHPVVESVQGPAHFIPNDLELDENKKVLIISGPNMSGKSTVLRQAAIILLLAQMGSFVPAREADLGLADRIFSRVGASDNLAQGRSTFMVEMIETARILRQASRRSLVILDEIGRGTSTFDGLALAWAVVEDLSRRGNGDIRTLFATHYHELTSLEGRLPGVKNMNIAIKEWGGEIIFLRRLVPGPSDRSYGIEVAKLAGVPQPVIQRAREILRELERRRDGGRAEQATQPLSLLPGVEPSQEKKPAPEPPPVLDALRKLSIDNLTPLEALNLLQQWKARWGNEGL